MILVFGIAVFFTFFILDYLLKNNNINNKFKGIDMHKENKHLVFNFGGFVPVICFIIAVILCSFITDVNQTVLSYSLLTILIVALIGLYDDIKELPQLLKALIPIPVAGILVYTLFTIGHSTQIFFPILGNIDFGILYFIILVPIGLAGASNLTNMLAGFNGNETGMAIIMFITLSILTYLNNSYEALIISVAFLGALIGFIKFNWYPAKAFGGDVLNLSIGAVLLVVIVLAKIEIFGIILVLPYIFDWILKARAKFPKSFAILEDGILYAPEGKPRGLADYILKKTRGLTELTLVIVLIGLEIVCAFLTIIVFLCI